MLLYAVRVKLFRLVDEIELDVDLPKQELEFACVAFERRVDEPQEARTTTRRQEDKYASSFYPRAWDMSSSDVLRILEFQEHWRRHVELLCETSYRLLGVYSKHDKENSLTLLVHAPAINHTPEQLIVTPKTSASSSCSKP